MALLSARGIREAREHSYHDDLAGYDERQIPMGLRRPVERTNSWQSISSAKEKHRPLQRHPPGPVRPGCFPHHHRHAGQVRQEMGLDGSRRMARLTGR